MSSAVASEAKQIGEYVLEHEVGRGAFGVVYRAHHRARPETPLALKVVQGRGNTDRMLLEPAVLSRLDHPNIVGLEDYFLRGDDLVLALEFIDGRDLRSLLEDGERFSQADVREMLVQLGGALAAAHDQNILHRDIKPANILVQREGDGWRFVLTDFGIGQVREGIQERKQTGGTYLFMAPEQLRGRPSSQSDLWALGVVAYRMLTGRMPFPGPSIQELTTQILYGGITSPSEVCKKPVDTDLERAILHLLDKSLQERTGSGAELLRELGVRESTAASRKGVPRTLPSSTLDEQLARSITRRRSWLALSLFVYLVPTAIVAGLLLVFGGTLFYLAQREQRAKRLTTGLLTLSAFAVLLAHVQMRYVFLKYDVGVIHFGGVIGPVLAGVFAILNIVLPIVAGSLFAGLRRLQREKLLRDLAREEGPGSDRYLQALQQALDSRFEDVGFHLKYAEALFARGRVKEAAAECRVLLHQDPYNFNGNLLLANAYYALGLDAECVAQCDGYLGVSGYCFEFSELRDQARRRSPE